MEDTEDTRKRKAEEITANESRSTTDDKDTKKLDASENPSRSHQLSTAVDAALGDSRPKPAGDIAASLASPIRKKKEEHPYAKLKSIVVKNDGRPESMIKLVGLKSLFAKQLPKMPRAYIARLVFDRRHVSLAILSDDPAVKDSDEEIIGGICFRPFQEMRFAEIAFCAVSATHQVKVSTRLETCFCTVMGKRMLMALSPLVTYNFRGTGPN